MLVRASKDNEQEFSKNHPRYRESILLHRNFDRKVERNGVWHDVYIYSYQIPEQEQEQGGFVTRVDAFEVAAKLIESRLAPDVDPELEEKHSALIVQLDEKFAELRELEAKVFECNEAISEIQRQRGILEYDREKVKNKPDTDISDGAPAELLDDYKMIHDTLVRMEGSEMGTIACRWDNTLDEDGNPKYDFDGDGDSDHRMVFYPKVEDGLSW
jgi:hypothetical protein